MIPCFDGFRPLRKCLLSLGLVILCLPCSLAFSGNPPSTSSQPRPIPHNVLRKHTAYRQRHDAIASADLALAAEFSKSYIDKHEPSLGDHWLLSIERAIYGDLEEFQSLDRDVQSQLRRAIGALHSAERAFNKKDYHLARTLMLQDALPYFKEHANDSFYYKRALNHYVLIDFMNGSNRSAKQNAIQATELSRRLFGREHVQYGGALMLEAAIAFRLSDYSTVEKHCKQVSEIYSKQYTKQLGHLALPSAYLALVNIKKGNEEKAREMARQAFDQCVVHGIPIDPNGAAKQFIVIATMLHHIRRYEEAQIALDKAFEIAENPRQPSPAKALAAYYEIQVNNYVRLGRRADAQRAKVQLKRYREETAKLAD